MTFLTAYVDFYRLWAPIAIACALCAYAIVLSTLVWIGCRMLLSSFEVADQHFRQSGIASTPLLPIPPRVEQVVEALAV